MSKINSSIYDYIKSTDKILWTIIISISIYCLLLMKSVSNAGVNFLTIQSLAIFMGYLGAICLQFIDYRTIAHHWKWIGAFCVLFIIYTLFFGITVEGSSGVNARAWIRLPGGITFQPSELVKIGFIITFSKHLYILTKDNNKILFKDICLLLIHAMIPVILTHLQGDDGAAIIFMCMALSMAFIAGVPMKYFISAFIIGVMLLPLIWHFLLADYQKQRLINQINPEADPLNMGYQQIQGKLSIASGGIFGKGLFHGPRVINGVVPIQESDFVFSVAGEELGFIGCTFLIILIFALLWRAAFIGKTACDKLGCYICFGFFSIVAAQTIFNLGMCLSALPVMGVTLPFFSAGGSSTACLYLGIGIIQNIYMNRMDKKENKLLEE